MPGIFFQTRKCADGPQIKPPSLLFGSVVPPGFPLALGLESDLDLFNATHHKRLCLALAEILWRTSDVRQVVIRYNYWREGYNDRYPGTNLSRLRLPGDQVWTDELLGTMAHERVMRGCWSGPIGALLHVSCPNLRVLTLRNFFFCVDLAQRGALREDRELWIFPCRVRRVEKGPLDNQ
jgi:hypothetical protein